MPLALHRLTIAMRLTLINLLLAIAIVAVSVMAWRSLDQQHAATRDVSRTNQAQRYHQDADMHHDAIRADLYAAFIEHSFSHLTPAQTCTNLRDDIMAFRTALNGVSKFEIPDELRAANEYLRTQAENYATATQETLGVALCEKSVTTRAMAKGNLDLRNNLTSRDEVG
jgi:hypothetical protein